MATDLAAKLVAGLRRAHLHLAVAESLTGGQLCATIVEVPGASDVLRGGVCTYAPDTKVEVLGVSAELIAERGTVNQEVAQQLAAGARRLFGSEVALATTGVAGPGPAEGHPAGTVYVAIDAPGHQTWIAHQFAGDRQQVRNQSVEAALRLLEDYLAKHYNADDE